MGGLDAKIHPLLTEEVVRALREKQVHTILDFVKTDTQQILKIARLNFKEVLAVKNFLLKKFSAPPINGFDYYKATVRNTAIIPTGIRGVDNLLDGGLFTGTIYEVCGLPVSGKTQFILSVIKNVAQNMEQQVYIFDTKNDFSGRKLNNMLNGHDKVKNATTLSKVIVNRSYTRHDLINGLYAVKKNLENKLKLRLIIIDSLPAVLLNSTDHSANNSYLNHLVNIIRYIAVEHYVAFLITNLITTWNDSDLKNQQDTTENVACGKYWFTFPNTRLKIEKKDYDNIFTIRIINSDTLNNKINSSTDILLTDEGFL